MVSRRLFEAFPNFFLAEENVYRLRDDDDLLEKVRSAVATEDDGSQPPPLTASEVVEVLALRRSHSDAVSSSSSTIAPPAKRLWCIDQIDGTRGFLRGKYDGGQYCVALALLEDGVPTVGVLECPNLPFEPRADLAWTDEERSAEHDGDDDDHGRGCVFLVSRGNGCVQLPLFSDGDEDGDRRRRRRLFRTSRDVGSPNDEPIRFCLGVELYSDARELVVPGTVETLGARYEI